MKITTISVTAGRTFNNPYESYSNLRPEVTMTATLTDGEDADLATCALQAKAEALVEQHKNNMLQHLNDLHTATSIDNELAGLEDSLKRAQQRMEELKQRRSGILVPQIGAGHQEA